MHIQVLRRKWDENSGPLQKRCCETTLLIQKYSSMIPFPGHLFFPWFQKNFSLRFIKNGFFALWRVDRSKSSASLYVKGKACQLRRALSCFSLAFLLHVAAVFPSCKGIKHYRCELLSFCLRRGVILHLQCFRPSNLLLTHIFPRYHTALLCKTRLHLFLQDFGALQLL